MLGTQERWLGLVVLGCAGCATLIGLPDLPDVSTAPGAGSAGTSPEAGGSSGTIDKAGDSSLGSSGKASANGGSKGGVPGFGGRSTDGAAGELVVAGSAGSAGTSGTAGSAGTGPACVPACADGMSCEAGKCQCSTGFSSCANACVNLQNDKDHCGTCTGTCKDGCSAGRCFTRIVALSPNDVVKFAVNATHIYFTARDAGTVSRLSRATGMLEPLASQQVLPIDIALDNNNVYWVNEGAPPIGNGTVMKMPLAGGAIVTLATGEMSPECVVVDANNVYWNNLPPNPGTIMKVPITGGDANKVELASGDPVTSVADFTIDATSLYFAGEGNVWKVSLNGGPIVNLAHVTSLAGLATVSGGNVYFVSGANLQKVSTAGGTPSILYPGASVPHMVADTSDIYLGEVTKHAILKIPIDGSKAVPLASFKQALLDIALYGNDLFWIDVEALKSTPKTP